MWFSFPVLVTSSSAATQTRTHRPAASQLHLEPDTEEPRRVQSLCRNRTNNRKKKKPETFPYLVPASLSWAPAPCTEPDIYEAKLTHILIVKDMKYN